MYAAFHRNENRLFGLRSQILIVFILNVLAIPSQGLAQWVQSENSGYSGSVYSLASDGNQLFVGTPDGVYQTVINSGLWKQYNKGLTSPFIETQINSLFIDKSKIYAGTFLGLYVSSIDVASWTLVGASIPAGLPVDVGVSAMIQVGDNYLLATEGNGIYISKNQGQTWDPSNTGLPLESFLFISSLIYADNVLYAGTQNFGIFQSLDNGNSWSAINNGLTFTNSMVHSFVAVNNKIFAGTDQGIFVSSNQGASWSTSNTGLPMNSIVNSMVVGGDKIFAGTMDSGIYMSTDQGGSWSYSGLLNDFVLAEINNTLYAGAGNGMYYSDDVGTTWNQFGTQLTNLKVSSLVVRGDSIFAGGDGGILLSTNDSSWISIAKTQNNVLISQGPVGPGLFYSTGVSVNYLKRSGNTWPETTSQLFDIYALFTHGDTIIAGSSEAIYTSTDNGNAWIETDSGMPAGYFVTSFAKNHAGIFVGTNLGVYNSKDGGITWQGVNNTLPRYTQVNVLLASGNKLYAGAYYGMFLSEDDGQSWTSINTGLPSLDSLSVNALASSNGVIFAGTSLGVHYSVNGTSWRDFNGTTPQGVFSLAIWKNKLLAGTNHWIYSIPLADSSVVTGDIPKDVTSSLFPNPSQKYIHITDIDQSINDCQIVDLVGRSTFFKIEQQGEICSIDISNLAKGVYVVILNLGDKIHQYKFVKY